MEIIKEAEKLFERADNIENIVKENKIVKEIVLALKNTIRENNLTGLSAPQIGYNKRIFVINYNGDLRTYINPIITKFDDFTIARETCSSIEGKSFLIPRYNKIQAMYLTPIGKAEKCSLVGASAYKFQHLVEHLEGVLVSDIGLEIDENFDKATDEEKEELIKAYLDSLDIKLKEIKKEIDEDKDLRQTQKAIEFVEKFNKGEIQFEKTEDENDGTKNKNKATKRN